MTDLPLEVEATLPLLVRGVREFRRQEQKGEGA